MAYTTLELALNIFKELFWNDEEHEFAISGKRKRDNYQKITAYAEYTNGGVLVTKYWEHLGHHERVLNEVFFKNGKMYPTTECYHKSVIGTYTELK